MDRTRFSVILFFAMAVAISPLTVYAVGSVMYVRSLKAPLLEVPQFKAKKLAELPRGSKLSVLEEKKKWLKVEGSGKTGWVSRLLVSKRPPMKRVSYIVDKSQVISSTVRKRASTVTTAGATRGLATDYRMRQSQELIKDFGAVEKLEAFELQLDTITAFHAQLK